MYQKPRRMLLGVGITALLLSAVAGCRPAPPAAPSAAAQAAEDRTTAEGVKNPPPDVKSQQQMQDDVTRQANQ